MITCAQTDPQSGSQSDKQHSTAHKAAEQCEYASAFSIDQTVNKDTMIPKDGVFNHDYNDHT